MTAQRSGSQGQPAEARRRSRTLPIYLAVIAIALIIVVRLLSGALSGSDAAPFEVNFNADVSTYWRDHGFALLTRSRALLPGILQDLADGQSCLPSSEFKAIRCPEIGDSLDGRAAGLRTLVDDARATTPPADSTASEWLALQLEGWEELLRQTRRFAEIARDGYDEQDWRILFAVYRDSDKFTQAELQLVRLLAEVAPADRAPR